MSDDALVVVQARTGSSRLPGKVLAPVDGVPLLAFQLARLAPTTAGPVVVATSTAPGDDAVARIAEESGVEVVRGSEPDVLDRFALAARTFGPAHVVRLTGDCPFTDPAVVDRVVAHHRETGADYTSNLFPRSYPKGLDVEVVRTEALLEAAAEATAPSEREHVTPFLYRRPERFRLANVLSGRDLAEEWWVVDTAEDLERVRAIVERVDDPRQASWEQVLDAAGTTAPDDGPVRLEVVGSSATGACPWVRTWTAVAGGAPVARVSVAVGEGQVERRVEPLDGGPVDERSILDALDRLLTHDEQVRA